MASSYRGNAGFRTQRKAQMRGDFVYFRANDKRGFCACQLGHFENDCGLATFSGVA